MKKKKRLIKNLKFNLKIQQKINEFFIQKYLYLYKIKIIYNNAGCN